MTIHRPIAASLASMDMTTRFSIKKPLSLAAACMLPLCSAEAEDAALRDLLRDGLYAEEVSRDPEAAAEHYEKVLASYSEQRNFAASALFRLAEVRRKQDRKEDAVKLYQRLIAEFPGAETEVRLAGQNLAALGATPPEMQTGGASAPDPESVELRNLQASSETAPDLILDPKTLDAAINNNYPRVVKYLVDSGSDPFGGTGFGMAVMAGRLDLVKILTGAGKPIPDEYAREAVEAAVGMGRAAVLEYLLKNGVKVAQLNPGTLRFALAKDQRKIAAMLLDAGFDINAQTYSISNQLPGPVGCALLAAVANGKFEQANWLLDRGAKAELPNAEYGLTPLHYAAWQEEPGCLPLMERLLKAGADPNRFSIYQNIGGTDKDLTLVDASPLKVAALSQYKSVEKCRLLLDHGADPNKTGTHGQSLVARLLQLKDRDVAPVLEMLLNAGASGKDAGALAVALESKNAKLALLLLKLGADPNARDIKGDPLMVAALRTGDTSVVKAMLDAGSDPGAATTSGGSLLRVAAQIGAVDGMALLADAGAKPEKEWADDRYEGARRTSLRFLLDRFVLPSLSSKEEINLVVDSFGGIEVTNIARKGQRELAPSLSTWLSANDALVSYVEFMNKPTVYHWRIWRKNGEGGLTEIGFDPGGDLPIPDLQWGDVVEARLMETDDRPVNYSRKNGIGAEVLWNLRMRQSFPVTIETGGESREYMMRGDRVIFDPRENVLPLCNARQAVNYFVPREMVVGGKGTIVVTRSGWPEVRMGIDSTEAEKFQLEAQDKVRVELQDGDLYYLSKARAAFVTLKVEGYSHVRELARVPLQSIRSPEPSHMAIHGNTYASIAASRGTDEQTLRAYNGNAEIKPGMIVKIPYGRNNPVELITAPTLVQSLVDLMIPASFDWSDWKRGGGKAGQGGSDGMAVAAEVFQGTTLVPFPDLSKIRIRRLKEGEGETVMEVDLSKRIAELGKAATPEQARAADILLHGGDIVEISLRKDMLGQPWKGYTDEENRFFALALSGKVQMVDDEGNTDFSEIDYRAPEFVETQVGWLPVYPETGVPSARAFWLVRKWSGRTPVSSLNVTRKPEVNHTTVYEAFLRDGDKCKVTSSVRQPRQPAPRPGDR